MTVTNTTTLSAYAEMSLQAYDNDKNNPTDSVAGLNGSTYIELTQQIDSLNGFQGRAFYNTQLNELVVAFTGTEGIREETNSLEFVQDLTSNIPLAMTGAAPQVGSAKAFIDKAETAAMGQLQPGYSITYVGHSLGGFLAQAAS